MKAPKNSPLPRILPPHFFGSFPRTFCIFFAFFAVFLLTGCGGVKDEVVKKYESSLNASFKEAVDEILSADEGELDLAFSPFKCDSSGGMIECVSKDLAVTDLINKEEMLKIAQVQIRTNAYYDGPATGLISVKDYYANIFARDKKISQEVLIQGLVLGDEIKSRLAQEGAGANDAALQNYLQGLINDEYELRASQYTQAENGGLAYTGSLTLAGGGGEFALAVDPVRTGPELYDTLDAAGVKFDSGASNLDTTSLSSILQDAKIEAELKKSLMDELGLNGASLSLRLKGAKGPLDKYLALAQLYLGQNAQNPQMAALQQKAAKTLEGVKDGDDYRLDLKILLSPNSTLTQLAQNLPAALASLTINGDEYKAEAVGFAGLLMFMMMGLAH